MQMTLAELASRLELTLIGDGDIQVSGLNTLKDAQPGDVSFLANPSYQSQLADSQASAVIVAESHADLVQGAALVSASLFSKGGISAGPKGSGARSRRS